MTASIVFLDRINMVAPPVDRTALFRLTGGSARIAAGRLGQMASRNHGGKQLAGHTPEPWRPSGFGEASSTWSGITGNQKKADVTEHLTVSGHVGILVNGPPDSVGLPFA
jgi:hypothetical protein